VVVGPSSHRDPVHAFQEALIAVVLLAARSLLKPRQTSVAAGDIPVEAAGDED